MSTDIRIVSRRGFLGNVFSAGALIVGAQFPLSAATTSTKAASAAAWHPNVYLGIDPDGTVIIVTHRSEMGTGIRSVLPVVLADELEADWNRVRLEQALGDVKYGSQNTDGSCSIRDFYDTLRESGATARMMLERAAASKWGVAASECRAKNHEVVHTSGKKLGYGELAKLASQQTKPAPADLKYKSPAEFRYIGKEMPTMDLADIVAGKGTFGMDAKVPGMVYASVERSPVFAAKLKRYDDGDARQVKGVSQVVVVDPFQPPHNFQPLGGVAVVADNTWSAMQGRKKLKVEWEASPHAAFESEAFKREMMATVLKPGKVVRKLGNVDAEFARAGKTHEATYYTPLLSHAPMEPPAAIAHWQNGKVEAWAATQNPQAVQETVAACMGIKKEDVTCHVTLLGGGFGRKSKPDYVAEAAMISKQVGKPVKVAWSREEDIQFDFYHTTAAMHLKAAIGDKGRPTAWLQRSVFPSIGTTFGDASGYGMEIEHGMGLVDLPYQIANIQAENGVAHNHVRIGWLRAVANIYHAFGIHSFVDELAAAAGRDRVEYILDLIGAPRKIDFAAEGTKFWNNGQSLDKFPVDTARLRRVTELVAEKSGWASKKSGAGHGWGIAAHRSFLTYVAVVAEVEVDSAGKVRIPRVDIAADPGMIINPDRVRAQFEGAAVFGASIAMLGEITAAGGKIQQSNFHNYPVARMNDAPFETHVHVVPSTAPPAGVGEPGVPPVAPAICNAIFAATGKRIRELPVRRTKLV
jgi:isoquinoline 1-oxidoreductase beta subunit